MRKTIKIVVIVLILFSQQNFLLGQELDTMYLEGIHVEASTKSFYAAGNKIEVLDSAKLASYYERSLSDLLKHTTPLYLRGNGLAGMGSGLSIRGTSSKHTAILWNGININSMTLGESDLDLLHVSMMDKVELHYGSSSALYGSDAIAGSINLYSNPVWKTGEKMSVSLLSGSLGQFVPTASYRYGNGKLDAKVKMMYQSLSNSFTFDNSGVLYGRAKETMKNAAVHSRSIAPELNYRIKNNQYLSLKGWYGFNHRQIQPLNSAINDSSNYAYLFNENIRLMMDYAICTKKVSHAVKGAYVHDFQVYNNASHIGTTRYITAYQADVTLHRDLMLQSGYQYQRIIAEVDGYDGIATRNMLDFFALLKYSPINRIDISMNMRQPYITGYNPWFTPSLGFDAIALDKGFSQLTVSGQWSRSYKTPTFNDLYWIESGNPDLRPEKGINKELSLGYIYQPRKTKLEIGLTAYKMSIEDIIHWRPSGDLWRPENVGLADIYGYEFSQSLTYENADVFLSTGGNLAYNQSINKELGHIGYGSQFAYKPEWMANYFVQGIKGEYKLMLDISYVGVRWTSGGYSGELDSYALLNLYLSKKYKINGAVLVAAIAVNNVLNKSYESYINHAMPGINIQASVKYNWNK